MAVYSRRADGLVDLEGAPAPLALSDDQLSSLGHVPAELRGPGPGALASNGGMGGAPGFEGGGNVPESRTDAGGWDPSMGGAPGFVHNPNAGTGTQSSVPNEREDTPMSATVFPAGDPSKPKPPGTTTLPDAPKKPPTAPSASGPKLIKGGIQLAGYKQETGMPLSEQDITDAVGLKRTELEANEQAQANRIKREAEVTKKEADQLASESARLAGEREKRKAIDEGIAEAESQMLAREQELAQIPAPKMKDFWEDKGIMGRIGAVLMLASGGALQGLQGGQNQGQQMLASIYDQWAGEKREEYERAGSAAARAKTRFGQLIERYGTPEEADKALRAEAAQVAGQQIANYSKMMSLPEQTAALQALQAQNAQETIKLKAEMLKAREGRIEKTFVRTPDRVVGGAPAKAKGMDRMVRLPGGGYGYARDATVARSAQKAIKANTRIKALSSELRALTKSVGNRSPTAEERARAETIASELKFTAKEAFEAGALDQGLLTEMNNYLGDPTALFSITDTDSKLDQVGRIADGKISEIYEYDLMADPAGTTPLVQDVAPQGVEAR